MDASTNASMTAYYRNFHLWMLVPFGTSVLGFSYIYYFNDVSVIACRSRITPGG